MKAYEYVATVLSDGHLSIPDEIKSKIKEESKVRVMILVDDEAAIDRFAMSEFLKGYSEQDSIYDTI